MRITNQMISGNSLRNMQKGIQGVDKTTQQLTSGKKIQKASEDPVIAIRALKLRTTVNQLTQYKQKNIPDANSWLEITETSLENVVKSTKSVMEYCVQGSTDSFNTTDRSSIIDALKQLQEMIYDEGNSSYAGRYIFSGYKTDKSLAFSETERKDIYSYDITERFTAKDIDIKEVVLNEVDATKVDGYLNGTETYEQINPEQVYRINLGYEGVDTTNNDGTNVMSFSYTSGGVTTTLNATPMEVADAADYYNVGDNDIHFIKETGELIFGEGIYNTIKAADSIECTYAKKSFEAGDLRPEMYYDCTQYTVQSDGTVKEVDFDFDEEGQPIYYEINFNQSIKVNTEGKDIIIPEIGKYINDLIYALEDMEAAEKNQAKLQDMLKDNNYANNEDAVKMINRMLSDIDIELAQKKENMQKTFSNNITNFQNYLDKITALQSDIGSRMSKLEMVKIRVTEQYESFTELKSNNEDINTEEKIIDFQEANVVYQTSLQATGQIMKHSLLDYI